MKAIVQMKRYLARNSLTILKLKLAGSEIVGSEIAASSAGITFFKSRGCRKKAKSPKQVAAAHRTLSMGELNLLRHSCSNHGVSDSDRYAA